MPRRRRSRPLADWVDLAEVLLADQPGSRAGARLGPPLRQLAARFTGLGVRQVVRRADLWMNSGGKGGHPPYLPSRPRPYLPTLDPTRRVGSPDTSPPSARSTVHFAVASFQPRCAQTDGEDACDGRRCATGRVVHGQYRRVHPVLLRPASSRLAGAVRRDVRGGQPRAGADDSTHGIGFGLLDMPGLSTTVTDRARKVGPVAARRGSRADGATSGRLRSRARRAGSACRPGAQARDAAPPHLALDLALRLNVDADLLGVSGAGASGGVWLSRRLVIPDVVQVLRGGPAVGQPPGWYIDFTACGQAAGGRQLPATVRAGGDRVDPLGPCRAAPASPGRHGRRPQASRLPGHVWGPLRCAARTQSCPRRRRRSASRLQVADGTGSTATSSGHSAIPGPAGSRTVGVPPRRRAASGPTAQTRVRSKRVQFID